MIRKRTIIKGNHRRTELITSSSNLGNVLP